MPDFIEDLKVILSSHTAIVEIRDSLDILFTTTPYGAQKNYPVAIVHEAVRIKEKGALTYFKEHHFMSGDGLTREVYSDEELIHIASHVPKYIQTVGFILATTKDVPHPLFSNKFKHDYWKKLTTSEGLEAVIDLSILAPSMNACEAEEELRSIIRKRKEVHQLKKIAFVWIVEILGKNSEVETVLKHYFNDDTMIVENEAKTYYIGWSTPLQSINMRYFVCPPA
jgi:hypothetical protein